MSSTGKPASDKKNKQEAGGITTTADEAPFKRKSIEVPATLGRTLKQGESATREQRSAESNKKVTVVRIGEEWVCACGFANSLSDTKCILCQAPRPATQTENKKNNVQERKKSEEEQDQGERKEQEPGSQGRDAPEKQTEVVAAHIHAVGRIQSAARGSIGRRRVREQRGRMQAAMRQSIMDELRQDDRDQFQSSPRDRWMRCEDPLTEEDYWFDTKTNRVSWGPPSASDINNHKADMHQQEHVDVEDGDGYSAPGGGGSRVGRGKSYSSPGGITSRTRSTITREILAEMELEDSAGAPDNTANNKEGLLRVPEEVDPIVQKAKEEFATLGDKTLDKILKQPKPRKRIKLFKKVLIKVGIEDVGGAHDTIVASILACDANGEFTREAFAAWFADHREQFKSYVERSNSPNAGQVGEIDHPFLPGKQSRSREREIKTESLNSSYD